eukprot:Phypoly_transcript_05828.p1 GENE.Phypoly_transcript_05828~~Phypoly_transcript_05828.p1  ORF type:complete len:477 (+),score=27.30 Phypoly_transcript_05828:160-1590(+)
MRYVYPIAVAVPPHEPSPHHELSLASPESVDTLQDLIHRRAEQRRNKLKYHLTEADGDLLCANGKELKFNGGHVIANQGAIVQAIYRIKCGTVSLIQGCDKVYDLPQGSFIGEALFTRGDKTTYLAALVANGPVVLCELNLPFVRQLLAVDKVLAFKLYRYIACKLSALVFAAIDLENSCTPYLSRGRSDSTWSSSSDGDELQEGIVDHYVASSVSTSSLSSGSSASSGLSFHLSLSNLMHSNSSTLSITPFSSSGQTRSPRMRSASQSCNNLTKEKPFKTYHLGEKTAGSEARLFRTKLVITAKSKLVPNKTIKYNKIVDMAKAARNSVTIIYGVQARTIFFNNEAEVEEFFGLVQSLVVSSTSPTPIPRSPSLSHHAHQFTSSPPDSGFSQEDKCEFRHLAVRHEFVKGEIVVAEGDLFQRIYTLVSGQLYMKKNGRLLLTVEEGEVFGYFSMKTHVLSFCSLVFIQQYAIPTR